MNELALFAGAGGGILGGKLLGWRTICAVENDGYARDTLVARQNDGSLETFPIWDDVQTFDGEPWRGRVDVISGGFPCQDISAAGKGAGIDGERSGMWSYMARIVGEVRPQFVFVENSPLLVGRGLARVLGDLAEMGYDARWCVLGAHHVGAPHKRDRIWIVANASGGRRGEQEKREIQQQGRAQALSSGKDSDSDGIGQPRSKEQDQREASGEQSSRRDNALRFCDDVPNTSGDKLRIESGRVSGADGESSPEPALANTKSERRQKKRAEKRDSNDPSEREGGESNLSGDDHESRGWWATEPDVGRVAHGVAARVDRLRCIGNGQVPAVAALAWRILTEDF